MKIYKQSIGVSIILLVGILLTACESTDEQDRTIVFADEGWDSVRFQDEVAGIILDAAYGYEMEETTGTSSAVWLGLEDGDIDVHMEGWTENLGEIYTKALDSGEVEEVSVNFDDNYQGLYVPTYVIEGDEERGIEPMAPDLKYITDLPDYQELFTDPEDPSMGRIIGAISGWSVDEMLKEAVEDYGLDETFNYMSPGSEAAINTSLVDAYEKGEPWLGYNYEPNWVMGLYDMTPIEDKDPDGLISQIASQDITVAINVDLKERAPEVVEFLEKYSITSEIASEALSFIQEEEATPYEAAVKFLQENEDIWSEWVPEEAVDKVKDSVDGQ